MERARQGSPLDVKPSALETESRPWPHSLTLVGALVPYMCDMWLTGRRHVISTQSYSLRLFFFTSLVCLMAVKCWASLTSNSTNWIYVGTMSIETCLKCTSGSLWRSFSGSVNVWTLSIFLIKGNCPFEGVIKVAEYCLADILGIVSLLTRGNLFSCVVSIM